MHRVLFDHLDARFPSRSPGVAEAVALAQEQMTKEQLARNASIIDLASYRGDLAQDVGSIDRPISRAYGFSGASLGVNSLINGAQGATGSNYFSYCFGEQIPEDVDLVVLELAINDGRYVRHAISLGEPGGPC